MIVLMPTLASTEACTRFPATRRPGRSTARLFKKFWPETRGDGGLRTLAICRNVQGPPAPIRYFH